jgi:hypothetical protein
MFLSMVDLRLLGGFLETPDKRSCGSLNRCVLYAKLYDILVDLNLNDYS